MILEEKKGLDIIILSTLAVGVGLTLNEANHVIHYERHWNPSKKIKHQIGYTE